MNRGCRSTRFPAIPGHPAERIEPHTKYPKAKLCHAVRASRRESAVCDPLALPGSRRRPWSWRFRKLHHTLEVRSVEVLQGVAEASTGVAAVGTFTRPREQGVIAVSSDEKFHARVEECREFLR